MAFLNFYFKLMSILILINSASLAYGQYGWTKHYIDPYYSIEFYDVEATQDGGYFMAGRATHAGGAITPVLIRLDMDGDVIWHQVYPNSLGGKIIEVKELPNGGAIFWCDEIMGTGQVGVIGTTPTGAVDWLQTYTGAGLTSGISFIGAYGIERTDDGNFILFNPDGTVFKVSPSGTLLWTKETYDPGANYLFHPSPFGHGIVEAGVDSFVFIGGESVGTTGTAFQMTAVLLDASGVLKREVLATNNTKGISVLKTDDQELIFCGNTDDLPTDSLVLVKTDINLNPIWTKKHLLDTVKVDIWDIEQASNGDIWCLGSRVAFSFGGGPQNDVRIYVYDENGNYKRTIELSNTLNTSAFSYSIYEQFELSLENPTGSLTKAADGNLVVGLSVLESPSSRSYLAHLKIDSLGLTSPVIEGKIFGDYNTNCTFDVGDLRLPAWTVEATRISDGKVFYGTSDIYGDYKIAVDSGTFSLSSVGLNYWQPCVATPQVSFYGQSRDTVDFALQPSVLCPLMQVDLSAPLLRATGGGSSYTVSACNLGTAPSPNTIVEVSIDPFLNVLGASIPILSQNNNLYTFNVGSVGVGACLDFSISVIVDTAAQIGQTHCSEAHIYPDSICIPNYWSGAIIGVNGNCLNDTTVFEITNFGTNMSNSLNYYVFEDHVMMRQGIFQLNNGVTDIVKQPVNPGRTYRLSADQETGFPALIGDVFATKAVEGCVTNSTGGFNTGFVNQFSNGSSSPFIAVDCQPSVAAFDPNDKSAQPEGYQSQHYIDTTTAIDYKIRFQNRGTDTAFYVMIKDTLSPYLDPSTIQMGASSHAYTWKLLDNGVLKVSFSNIKLVDSTTNEPLSHGFFRYKIQQKANNSAGTVINNSAAIYFDYNPPIITNTTFHTIGENFITIILSTEQVYENDIAVKVYPNPFKDFTTLEVRGKDYESLTLEVYDLSGRIIQTLKAKHTSTMKIYSQDLPQGVYIYELKGDHQRISTGKLIVQAN